jgi:hypothetical protein
MFRPKPQEHFIDDGHVYCPLRKRDVEFDLCAGCRWTKSIDLNANPPVVRCEPESAPGWLIRPWL